MKVIFFTSFGPTHFISEVGDLTIDRVFYASDFPEKLYPATFDGNQCIDSDMATMCKGTSTSPNWIKLEMTGHYFIEAVTIWRPFESSSYTEDSSQQKGQKFEVKIEL